MEVKHEETEEAEQKPPEHEGECTSGIITALAELSDGSIVTEAALARIFKRHPVSIKRAVQRGELPPPTRLLGEPVWTASTILRHIEKRLEAARKEAERTARRINELSP